MQANLYIISESFQSNVNFTKIQIEEKIKRLAEDVVIINKYSKENKIFVNYNLVCPIKFYSEYSVEDFICRQDIVKKTVDRDVINALQLVFQKATNTSITSYEIINSLLPVHSENLCNGLIAFHTVDNVAEEFQLIYGIEGWYKFRRYFLGLYPNVDTFIIECSKYFPNLYFHNNNNETVKLILENFSISIVKHLACLNDVLITYRNRFFDNETKKYQTFTSECSLEEDAASKDSNDSKSKLTFEFTDEQGKKESVTCYPHLRLCRSDKFPGDKKYYKNRIYFHEGIKTIQKGNILIGHIGKHL